MAKKRNEAKFTGFAFLTTPDDLLAKLKHDLHRMGPTREGCYAMYDFFITADNLCDWWQQQQPESCGGFREKEKLRRVVAQIANTAKHYKAEDQRHQSLSDLFKDGYVEDGYVEEGYFEEPPTVTFEIEDAEELHFPLKMELQELARRVYEHWYQIIIDSQA
jgi:hypothetical protein